MTLARTAQRDAFIEKLHALGQEGQSPSDADFMDALYRAASEYGLSLARFGDYLEGGERLYENWLQGKSLPHSSARPAIIRTVIALLRPVSQQDTPA